MEQNQKESNNFEEMDINSDADIPGNTHLNNEHNEENEQAKLEEELKEEKEKYLRLLAEFDNFKKRNAKERLDLLQTASRDVITSLLETLDDIDRAEEQFSNAESKTQFGEGIELIFSKVRKILHSKGLKAMKSIGEHFDEEKHDAIQIIDAGKEKSHIIIDETQKGYYLNDKIIRHAKVVVGK